MPFATTHTVALSGAVGHLVEVQADVSSGQVATVLVGRPDSALNEARDRCRMAILNSQHDWPATRRTTILLSPADLPKRGTHYDLAIARSDIFRVYAGEHARTGPDLLPHQRGPRGPRDRRRAPRG